MATQKLLEKISKGDKRAFAQFYELHRRGLLAYASALLAGDMHAAEDVVDDAYLDIWKNRASCAQRGSEYGWIKRIVRNKAVDWLRKYGEAKNAGLSPAIDADISLAPGPEELTAKVSDSQWLRSALSCLSLPHRETMQLFYFEEMSLAEIAALMDCPANTVKTRLHYARKTLADKHPSLAN